MLFRNLLRNQQSCCCCPPCMMHDPMPFNQAVHHCHCHQHVSVQSLSCHCHVTCVNHPLLDRDLVADSMTLVGVKVVFDCVRKGRRESGREREQTGGLGREIKTEEGNSREWKGVGYRGRSRRERQGVRGEEENGRVGGRGREQSGEGVGERGRQSEREGRVVYSSRILKSFPTSF